MMDLKSMWKTYMGKAPWARDQDAGGNSIKNLSNLFIKGTPLPMTHKQEPMAHFEPSFGSNGMWVQPIRADLTNPYPELSRGIRTSPDLDLSWSGSFSHIDSDVLLIMGMEEWSTINDNAIFVYSHNGYMDFLTKDSGISTSTDISGSVSADTLYDFKLEWRGGTRATLFVDGSQVVEHTSNVPNTNMILFIEANHSADPGHNSFVKVSPDFFRPDTDV